MTFAEIAEVYLDDIGENRTEPYRNCHEKVLQDILPRIGNMSCLEVINALLPDVESASKDRALEVVLAINAVQDVIGWALRNIAPDLLVKKTDKLNG